MRVLLLCLLCLVGAIAQAAAAPPGRIEIRYAVQFGAMTIGEGRDVFEHQNGRYQIRSTSKTVGLAAVYRLDVKRESRGRIEADGLRPEFFENSVWPMPTIAVSRMRFMRGPPRDGIAAARDRSPRRKRRQPVRPR